jgi:hypothetical protein
VVGAVEEEHQEVVVAVDEEVLEEEEVDRTSYVSCFSWLFFFLIPTDTPRFLNLIDTPVYSWRKARSNFSSPRILSLESLSMGKSE